MQLELLPESPQEQEPKPEGAMVEVARDPVLEELGLTMLDLSLLANSARNLAGIKGPGRGKGPREKFTNALWGLMQRDVRFGTTSENQLHILRLIMDQEFADSLELNRRRIKGTADRELDSVQEARRRRIDESIAAANEPNPW